MKQNGHLKIERGIEMPPARGNRSLLVETMKSMKVGDSFLYPLKDRTHISLYAKRAGVKVTQRISDEANVRVWRIA